MNDLGEISLLGDSQVRRLLFSLMKHHAGSPTTRTDFIQGGLCSDQLKIEVRRRVKTFQPNSFILIGINDILNNLPIYSINNNISTIIRVLSQHRKTILIPTLPPDINQSTSIEQAIQSLNIFIQSLSTHPSVSVIKFHLHFPPFTFLNKQIN